MCLGKKYTINVLRIWENRRNPGYSHVWANDIHGKLYIFLKDETFIFPKI